MSYLREKICSHRQVHEEDLSSKELLLMLSVSHNTTQGFLKINTHLIHVCEIL